MLDRADVFADVLIERAAERHVEQLRAAADTERSVDGPVGQLEFGAVALGVNASQHVEARNDAVALWRDVAAAGEQQSVEAACEFAQRRLAQAQRHQQWSPACAFNALHDAGNQPIEVDTVRIVVRMDGDSDEWPDGHG